MKDKTLVLCSRGAEDTFQLGCLIGGIVQGVVCLEGELGSGKTLLAKGIAHRMAISEDITSPTFSIIHYYERYGYEFYHMDAYRITHPDMLRELEFEEILQPRGITVIEWADRIRDQVPYYQLWIRIIKSEDEERRLIYLTGKAELVDRLAGEEEA